MMSGMIGLEIHGYLITKEKLFCKCGSHREKDTKPNTFICEICTAQPGAKPMLPNEEAVKKAVMIGLMLGCKINGEMAWQRKHYNWPDLPKGYQNTLSGSYATPLGEKGNFSGIKISSMHLEEDPASWEPETGEIDYNRSGLPLVEIITDPDFSTSEEVVNWLKKLIHNLSYLKIIDSNAGIKVDVNVNIPGKTERVEIKNVNSIENIGLAIDSEFKRQLNEFNEGRKVKKETRRFDVDKGITVKMRSKEDAEDYRFISDPDLLTLNLKKKFVEDLRNKLPESPEEKLKKIIKKYKIDDKNARILTKNIDIVEFFESVANKVDGKFALPWITIELLRVLNYNKVEFDGVDIKADHFVALLNLVKDKKITELQAKQILNEFYPKSFDPTLKVKDKIINSNEIEDIVKQVIRENDKSVSDYKNGELKAFNYLMGMVMKKSQKRADYEVTKKMLEKFLR